jgi:PAX-interacting protein 1
MSRMILTALGLLVLIAGVVGAQPGPQAPPPGQPQPPPGQPQPPPPPQRPPDPLQENIFPPELVMRNAEEIRLTDEQREFIASECQKVQGRFPELHQQLQKEVQAMAALMKEERPDAEKVLALLDKVLAAERELRRTHLTLMLTIKSKLTAAQQTQLQELKQKQPPEGPRPGGPMPPASFQAKIQKVQALVRQWETEGRELPGMGQMRRELDQFMREQKFAEAEAVLDKALDLLGDDGK